MSGTRRQRQTQCLDVSPSALEAGAAMLANGGLVAFPTETVYGLGGDACNAEAVAAIFAAKGRPAFNPLISHVDTAEHAFALGVETPAARVLADRVDIILDGGRCDSGVESTVVDCSGDKAVILRPGGITREELAACLVRSGLELATTIPASESGQPASPGMLASHYAPRAALEMNVTHAKPGMELIGFADIQGDGTEKINLSPTGDLVEAAANLFEMLHRADAHDSKIIGVAPIPTDGIGEAINDRLRRAAAPRTDAYKDA